MIDKKAFYSLSYGLYIITTTEGDRPVGCVVNTFQQVTSSPFQVSVALNKENATTQALLKTGRYVATCLGQSASMELIGAFGFHTSKDTDKFAGFVTAKDEAGIPYVAQQFVARFSVRVVNTLDVGSHIIFIGEVEEAAAVEGDEPMTYAYYHAVKGGKTPPKASSYVPDEPAEAPTAEKHGWRCTVCGYIAEVDELPDDYKCPICGAGKDKFERI